MTECINQYCTFQISELVLDVQVEPEYVAVIDVSPSFTLTCYATLPPNVTASKSFEWRMGPADSYAVLTHNGVSVNITDMNLEDGMSTSRLTATGNTVGATSYTCVATALGTVVSNSVIVEVKGRNGVVKV